MRYMHHPQFSEKELEIFRKYPKMFRQAFLTVQKSTMAWGLEIPEDFFPEIDEMAAKIQKLVPEGFEFSQIKTKFGGLRVYWDYTLPYDGITNEALKAVDEIISFYEVEFEKKHNNKKI